MLFCLLSSMPVVHAAKPEIDAAFLTQLINDVKSSAELPSGTSVSVLQGDKVIYQADFGYRDIAQQLPVDKDTRFYIASTTKPFTALNYLLDAKQLPALQRVTLEEMFPEMDTDSPIYARRHISAKHLLTHTASINNFPLVLATAYIGEHSPDTLRSLVTQHSTYSSEPVGEFKYTNVGYNIYSIYSDGFFKKNWQDKLQQQVFSPAGMTQTTAIRSDIPQDANVAKSYSLPRHNRREALYLEKTDNTLHAAGGIYSTSTDLGKFLIAQLNNGAIDGKQVYPADVIALSHQQQATTDKTYGDFVRDGYAWGWYTGDYKNQRMLHHFGGFAGIHAHLSFIPEAKLGLVVLNAEDFLSGRLTGLIADYVYGALFNETDIKEKVTKRVSALKSRLSGIDKLVAKEREKVNSRTWQLSLPAEAYVGEFNHPLLGSVKITLNEKQRFDVSLGVMQSDSTGMDKKDAIRVTLDPTSGTVIQFNCTEKVESLSYGGVEFTKVR